MPCSWGKTDKNHKPIRSTSMSFALLPLYSDWPPKGFLHPEVLLDLSNFCQRLGKRKELTCIQSFFLSQCWRIPFFRLSVLLLLSALTLLPQLPERAESSLCLGMFCFTRHLDLLFKMPPSSSCPVPATAPTCPMGGQVLLSRPEMNNIYRDASVCLRMKK